MCVTERAEERERERERERGRERERERKREREGGRERDRDGLPAPVRDHHIHGPAVAAAASVVAWGHLRGESTALNHGMVELNHGMVGWLRSE